MKQFVTMRAGNLLESMSAPLPLPEAVSLQEALSEVLSVKVEVQKHAVLAEGSGTIPSPLLIQRSFSEVLDGLYSHIVIADDERHFVHLRKQLGCDEVVVYTQNESVPECTARASMRSVMLYTLCFKRLGLTLLWRQFLTLLLVMQREGAVILGDTNGKNHWIAVHDTQTNPTP